MTQLIFLSTVSDIDVIPSEILLSEKSKVYSLDFEVHQKLNSKNVKHEIGDNLLNQNERLQIFDKATELRYWYSNLANSELEVDDVNILKLFDSHEFHSFLIPNIINLVLIKKIIELENPSIVISSTSISKLIQSVLIDHNIKTQFFDNNVEEELFWDTISVKYNLGKFPITLNLSQKNYQRIKNFLESILGKFYGFWYDFSKSKKKCLVFLEFNPEYFHKLFSELSTYDEDVVLINLRRSPIWGKKSLDILKHHNCKVLKFDDVLSQDEKNAIPSLNNELSQKLDRLWENSEFFNEIFQIDGCSFWNAIKEGLVDIYNKKTFHYLLMLKSVKKILKNIDARCIVSLNEVGETEKTFLEVNNKKIPSIVLEHGFLERIEKTKRFDIIGDYVKFKDRIAVWGHEKKSWLINEHQINPDRIIVTGSPRHDVYFNSRLPSSNPEMKTLLLAPNPISAISGLSSTELKTRFNTVLKEIFTIVKQFPNVQIIVKLHPIRLKHNEEIKSLIQHLDSSVPILLWTPVIETINQVDAVLVISPEIYGTSTMLLESMILGKPTMNIYFDSEIPKYGHVKDNAILTITNNQNIELNLKKILFDNQFRDELRQNADNFVNKFISNHGTASKTFASFLQSI